MVLLEMLKQTFPVESDQTKDMFEFE